jgi:hypothetical protein
MDNCVNCKFTPDKVGGSLVCHRFPKQQRVARDYWCGEWRPDISKERKNGTDKKPASK